MKKSDIDWKRNYDFTYFVIPARKGSKGYPGKNRKLFDSTLGQLKKEDYKTNEKVIVTTNDEIIFEESNKLGFNTIWRSEELSSDTANVRDVLLDVVQKKELRETEIIVLLYLTYPLRSWGEIMKALDYFIKSGAKSMLCKQPVLSNPYLCMYEKDNNEGEQIIKHDLCRRQDYKPVFEISHYMGIFQVSEIKNLNKNMYNEKTKFFPIERAVDIDYEKDFLTDDVQEKLFWRDE